LTPELKKQLELGPFVILIIFILAGLIALVPQIIQNYISSTDLVIAFAILSISSFIGGCTSILLTRGIHDIQCQNCVDDLKMNLDLTNKIMKLTLDKSGIEYEALVPFDELKKIESDIKENGEIWVATSDLKNEENRLKETIFQNIKKQVKYVYFLPNENRITYTKNLLKVFNEGIIKCGKSLDETDNVLHLYEVPKHFLYLDFVVYNPSTSNQIVLFLLPHNKKNGDDELYYRVPNDQAHDYIESLNQLASENVCKKVNKVDIDLYNSNKKN